MALLRSDAADRHRARLRSQGEPDAGRGSAPERARRLVRRRLAGEMHVALDTPMPADPGELCRARQDARRAAPGGRRRRHDRARVRDRGRSGSRRSASASASGPASRCASIPTSEVKGSGMRMGGGPQQFGVDAERVPALLDDLGRRRSGAARLSRLRRLAESAMPRSSARRSARPSSWSCGSPRAHRHRSAT